MTYKEDIVTFGKGDSQVGIITESVFQDPKSDLPAVIILNAGILHRVGPYRSFVELARKISGMGFKVFRFDLSGLGDSERLSDNRSDAERAYSDIQAAMNYLDQAVGSKKFLFIGLCSGADHAHPIAVNDHRVVGGVFLDGFVYKTPLYYFHHYWPRIWDMRRWQSLVRRTWVWLQERLLSQVEVPKVPLRTYVREFPPQEKVAQELAQLVNRGMKMLFVYTSGVINHINYRGQFRDMFPELEWKDCIQLEYNSKADHTYSVISHREWLHQTILTWMKQFVH